MKKIKRKKKEAPFSKILCDLMDKRGVKISEAAKVAGVSISTISDWKTGSTPQDMFAVKKLAKHLGVSLEYLLTGEDTQNQSYVENKKLEDLFEIGDSLYEGIAKISIQKINLKK
jgi:transcriptional regulator with XRE-family HTH domain